MAQRLRAISYTSLALDLSADPSPTLADSPFFSLKCTPLSILIVTILVNASPQITAVVSMARRPQYFAPLPNSSTSITFLLYCHRHFWTIFSSFPTLNTWAHILVHVGLPRAVSRASFPSLWPASSRSPVPEADFTPVPQPFSPASLTSMLGSTFPPQAKWEA